MKKHYILRFCFFWLWLACFTSCVQKEEDVTPQATCDTMAVVEYVPSCGLQLTLENGNGLVPLNAKIISTNKEKAVFEINGFTVQEGQQIIVGYKTISAYQAPSPCNVSNYYKNKSIHVTCIVGLEQPRTH